MNSFDFGSVIGPQMLARGGRPQSMEEIIQRLLADPKTHAIGLMLLAQLQGQGQAQGPQHLARGGLAGMPNFGGLNSVRELNLGYGIK